MDPFLFLVGYLASLQVSKEEKKPEKASSPPIQIMFSLSFYENVASLSRQTPLWTEKRRLPGQS